MKLTIRLRYQTRFGQALLVCGNHELLGGGRPAAAAPLRYVNQDFWEISLEFPKGASSLRYYFILRDTNGSALEDFGGDRRLDLRSDTLVLETWNDSSNPANAYFTEPFKNVLLGSVPEQKAPRPPSSVTHVFHAAAPLLPKGLTLCVLGNAPALGDWNPARPVLLEGGDCAAGIDLSRSPFPVEYKYGIYDLERKALVQYEDGENRVLTELARSGELIVVNDGFARLPANLWRGAGVAVPVFSLRSARGFGVGEFLDLKLLADWAKQAGLKLIQILPVNDTIATHTWKDSYPYASISAFALHPIYLNLERLGPLSKDLEETRQRLNALPALDYEAVIQAKMEFIRAIFPAQRETALASAPYREFLNDNRHWLESYAAFCVLRDKYGTADFHRWPEHRVYDKKKIAAMPGREEMDLHYFIQFHLHTQLREAADYLHAQGLILKGDIAIGVHPHGADVWHDPDLFNPDMQTGAPPDAFAAKGQNWGFPTYNWPRMQEDGFDWWKRRFAQMGHYFDAFRIDHILGFFRIWSIPRHAIEGILGYFVPALPMQENEFTARGVAFNRERYVRPWINDSVLQEVFGNLADEVKWRFLELGEGNTFALKRDFATQRQVEDAKVEAKFKEGLFDLISNVLLIAAPGGGYHFRFGIEQTSSFRQLDSEIRGRLRELYIDYFYRRQENFWKRESLQKLPALKRVTNMLVCGEDLGMVPACVPVVMKQLGLLSLEIQRMPKALGADFSRPTDAPYLSVVTPSTHDMSTIRGWWLEEPARTQLFFNQELKQSGPAPVNADPRVVREVIRQHLDSPAMWSIFQLQDLLGMDDIMRRNEIAEERINIPAIVNYYWRYRMHMSVENLVGARNFTRLLGDLIKLAGR